MDYRDVIQQTGSTFLAMRLDYVGGSNGQPLYQGWSMPGTLDSVPGWKITKFTFTGDGQVSGQLWASGTGEMTKVWNDRASYIYS